MITMGCCARLYEIRSADRVSSSWTVTQQLLE